MIDLPAKTSFAVLPTPVSRISLRLNKKPHDVWVKHDDISGEVYGGNKVRKLEYILHRATLRKATRVATFGAVGSNHALATAFYSNQLGLDCTCLLSHQTRTDKTVRTLQTHVALQTELVYYGGDHSERIRTMRRYVQGRNCWVIPMGGSSWLGSVGFVNAALELAEQVDDGRLPCPDELYVATGTMGTTAGLALGLAMAGLPTRVQAIRVTDERFANRQSLGKLIRKTAAMLRHEGCAIPEGTEDRVNISFRGDFFAGGYARADEATENAVATAADGGLALETTYTGKAMAALLHDVDASGHNRNILFWNTYNSRPLGLADNTPFERDKVPDAFRRYFD